MANAKGIRAGRAFVEISLDTKQLIRGISAVKTQFVALGASMRQMSYRFIAAGTVSALVLRRITNSFLETTDQIDKLSIRIGASTDELQELGFAADKAGTDMETIADASVYLNAALVRNSKAFNKLGISVKQLMAMKPGEQFEYLSNQVKGLSTPRALAVLTTAFGRGRAGELMPFMQSDIAGERARAANLGGVIPAETVRAGFQLQDILTELKWSFRGLAAVAGQELTPFIRNLTANIGAGANRIAEWIKNNKTLIGKIAIIGVTLAGLSVVLGAIGLSLLAFQIAIGSVVSAVAVAAKLVFGFAAAIVTLGTGLIKFGISAVLVSVKFAFTKLFGVLAAITSGFLALTTTIWATARAALSFGAVIKTQLTAAMYTGSWAVRSGVSAIKMIGAAIKTDLTPSFIRLGTVIRRFASKKYAAAVDKLFAAPARARAHLEAGGMLVKAIGYKADQKSLERLTAQYVARTGGIGAHTTTAGGKTVAQGILRSSIMLQRRQTRLANVYAALTRKYRALDKSLGGSMYVLYGRSIKTITARTSKGILGHLGLVNPKFSRAKKVATSPAFSAFRATWMAGLKSSGRQFKVAFKTLATVPAAALKGLVGFLRAIFKIPLVRFFGRILNFVMWIELGLLAWNTAVRDISGNKIVKPFEYILKTVKTVGSELVSIFAAIGRNVLAIVKPLKGIFTGFKAIGTGIGDALEMLRRGDIESSLELLVLGFKQGYADISHAIKLTVEESTSRFKTLIATVGDSFQLLSLDVYAWFSTTWERIQSAFFVMVENLKRGIVPSLTKIVDDMRRGIAGSVGLAGSAGLTGATAVAGGARGLLPPKGKLGGGYLFNGNVIANLTDLLIKAHDVPVLGWFTRKFWGAEDPTIGRGSEHAKNVTTGDIRKLLWSSDRSQRPDRKSNEIQRTNAEREAKAQAELSREQSAARAAIKNNIDSIKELAEAQRNANIAAMKAAHDAETAKRAEERQAIIDRDRGAAERGAAERGAAERDLLARAGAAVDDIRRRQHSTAGSFFGGAAARQFGAGNVIETELRKQSDYLQKVRDYLKEISAQNRGWIPVGAAGLPE